MVASGSGSLTLPQIEQISKVFVFKDFFLFLCQIRPLYIA